jgi:hypothetical protein
VAPTPGRLQLALPPERFGRSLSLQQQLHISASGHTVDLDAALDITPQRLTLVAMEMGQRVLTLTYADGTLCEQRHPKLPAAVRGRDVLTDLQLALWPADAIRSALPAGWSLADSGDSRALVRNGGVIETIHYSGTRRWTGTITLRNAEYDYDLVIRSAVASP